MELASYSLPAVIRNDSLDFWQLIGCGGFGKIFRAKHLTLRLDVAVKLLRCDDGSNSTLLREANLMHHGGNPYVLRILGVYEGQPKGEEASQFGLVMEYMERGSLVDLQRALNGPPPWSLAFRIAHQIALGMNFLHQLDPPLLHLDLKPSNVLLDDSLNAKLTDFGLAKVARSVSKTVKEEDGEMGGTTSYMPPEAFQSVSYKPSFSSDIYSYGVLLWSVLTGKEPYDLILTHLLTTSHTSLSHTCNPHTPCLLYVSRLVCCVLITDCVDVTSDVYEMHRQEINDDVYATLKLLVEKSFIFIFTNIHISRVSISLSNVTGVQIGHNNYMNVNLPRQKQRQRHPTAPAQLNTSNAHQPSRPNPHPKP
uniref:Receptor-interacting serine-threonine kinase 3 n=1 Tax=Astyanax mexicanus TaxID=7994 RepID=A0A8B9LQF1_ASTMX